MPQACEESRQWAREKFGDIDDGPIIKWLESQGFELQRGFTWILRGREPTEEEWKAVHFLCDEWDFGEVQIHA